MQDNNPQNSVPNQAPFEPQSDLPPMPRNLSQPAAPSTPLPAPVQNMPIATPPAPVMQIPPIPQIPLEVSTGQPPKKGSFLTKIALILLILSLLAGGGYFIYQKYFNIFGKLSDEEMSELQEILDDPNADSQLMDELNSLPPAEAESEPLPATDDPGLIPTLPEEEAP